MVPARKANEGVASLKDINGRELLILATLAVVVLLFGVWPAPILEVMHPTVDNLIQHVVQSKL